MITNSLQFSNASGLAAKLSGARRSGNGWMACCPCHPDRTPSLSIRDGDSAVITTCFSKGCSYAEVMRAISGEYVPNQCSYQSRQPKTDTSEKARQIWSQCQSVQRGDPVWKYLNETRGLPVDVIPTSIRYHPQLEYWESSGADDWVLVGTFPAMVSVFTNIAGDVVGIHRTYLTDLGGKAFDKDSGRDCRKTLGSIHGAAIRFFPEAPVIGVAEGIETALAAHRLFDIPTWATYSTSGMQNVVIPPSVSEVIIFADKDRNRAGEIAAEKLAARLVAEGRKAKILAPETVGSDWADILSFTGEKINAEQ
jgi:putative DNA primase/helicase